MCVKDCRSVSYLLTLKQKVRKYTVGKTYATCRPKNCLSSRHTLKKKRRPKHFMTEWATSRHCLTPCATLKHRCRSKHSDRNVQVEALINTLPYTPPERKAKRLETPFVKWRPKQWRLRDFWAH